MSIYNDIVIHRDSPPIPMRDFDWVAYRESSEVGDPIGHGPTPMRALQQLLDSEEGREFNKKYRRYDKHPCDGIGCNRREPR